MKAIDPIKRFWNKVDIKSETECWNWKDMKDDGVHYPNFWDGSVQLGAHRFSLQIKIGRKLRKGEFALHRCDKKTCVNPNHLFVGTAKDNSADMVAKGRKEYGSRVYGSVLVEEQVVEIRNKYKEGTDMKSIAELYGISYENVAAIISGKTWVRAGGPIDSSPKKPGPIKGSKRRYRILTEQQIKCIKEQYKTKTGNELAKQYGVSRSCIRKACLS
jgi:predicted DNA-binding protein YlxM (UPF0122 family)